MMIPQMLSSWLVAASAVVAVVVGNAQAAENINLDRFNYGVTEGTDYGPPDWINVGCSDPQTCQGWPDGWEMAVGWELEENSCVWCPKEEDHLCGTHHQSPINLERNRAIEGNEYFNECIDIHWMAYFDSTCDFDILKAANAFSIERHALKIAQPLEEFEPNKFRLGCRNSNGQRNWGRIDFSRGFSHWWHLSHIDFHVPSEHTQEGKRYDGELQMYHWYSVNASVAGVHNEMASVTIFLQAYDNTADYDMLNKLICQWRKAEESVRRQCNLPSISVEYPGCFFYYRGHVLNHTSHEQIPNSLRRKMMNRGSSPEPFEPKPLTAHDIIVGNYARGTKSSSIKTIEMNQDDYASPERLDWDEFIASQHEYDGEGSHRNLIDFNHVGPFSNYFPMLDVRTEYYYRYSGTQTVPPCYGKWFAGNDRHQTNHWRVMKDPIRVSKRQIQEMHRLLRERIAPPNHPLNPCQPDTAGKIDPNDPSKISVARPLQSTREVHFKVFCECDDWQSKWMEDQEWCKKEKMERFYKHPYNFETNGF